MKKLPTFWIEQKDDEHLELFLGEKSVGSFNHDEHGWSGMSSAKKLFEAIAKEIGATLLRL